MLINGIREVEIKNIQSVVTAQDNPNPETSVDFTSSAQDRVVPERVPMLSADDLLNLPKGQCFAALEGNKIYKIRMPIAPKHEYHLPENIEAIASDMKKKYVSSDDFWIGKAYDLPIAEIAA